MSVFANAHGLITWVPRFFFVIPGERLSEGRERGMTGVKDRALSYQRRGEYKVSA
jgi:hypothetical protein